MSWFLFSPAIELMLTIAPWPFSAMCGATSWHMRKPANTLSW